MVRIAYLQRANDVYMLRSLEVEVYKLGADLWEMVNSKGHFNCKLNINYPSIYLNGAIHWFSHARMKVGKSLIACWFLT